MKIPAVLESTVVIYYHILLLILTDDSNKIGKGEVSTPKKYRVS